MVTERVSFVSRYEPAPEVARANRHVRITEIIAAAVIVGMAGVQAALALLAG